MLRTLFALPRSVWLLGLISLVNDSASELVYPLVPLYLSGVLMAGPSLLFGWLWEGLSAATAFGFSAGCALGAAVLLLTWARPAVHAGPGT